MIYLVVQAPKRTLKTSIGLSSVCVFIEAKNMVEAIKLSGFKKDSDFGMPYAKLCEVDRNEFYI
jgi:hypothetical protein